MKKYILIIFFFIMGCFFLFSQDSETVYEEYAVEIKGAVKYPGVYKIKDGDRVIDLIRMSGGTTDLASTKYINLSRKLRDGDVVIVYTNEEVNNTNSSVMISFLDNTCVCPEIKNDACIDNTISNDIVLVNINTANIDELMSIKGIGKTKAEAIIEYRSNNGNFNSIEDITRVKGIGNSTYEKIKEYITV